MLYAIVSVVVIILDQWVKYWVSQNLAVGVDTKELISGIVSLVNVHNDGAAFSFLSGSNARIYFIAICGVFTVAIIIALATRLISGPIGRWSAVFVMAGGLANCIDRILYGYVQDMFKLDFWPSFAVFNVADIFITVFCIVFILYTLFGGDREPEYDEDDDYDEDDEFDEYEEERPSLFSRLRGNRFDDEDEDDEDDDYDEKPARSRRRRDEDDYDEPPRKRASDRSEPPAERRSGRQQRRSKYEEEYEQYKANRAARQRAEAEQSGAAEQPAPPVSKPQPIDPADPFAEWERASAKVEARKDSYAAARRTGAAEPSFPDLSMPEKRPEPVMPAPEKKPVEPSFDAEDEFSLDDILAEFK